MIKGLNFCAIDFETMTNDRVSACSVGMVKVVDGEIADTFYSLLNPVMNGHKPNPNCINVHGIKPEDVVDAPVWPDVFPKFEEFAESGVIAFHDKGTEPVILGKLAEHFNLPQKAYRQVDTMRVFADKAQKKLADACEELGIDLSDHHNALCDAKACAEIVIRRGGVDVKAAAVTMPKKDFASARNKGHVPLLKKNKTQLPDDEILDKNTPFYGKSIVRTGTFKHFDPRTELENLLHDYGAEFADKLSDDTRIMIIGEGAGPKKMKEAKGWLEKGTLERIMTEEELLKELDKYNIKY